MRKWHATFGWVALSSLGTVLVGGALLSTWDKVVPLVRAQEPRLAGGNLEREPLVPEESGPRPCDDPDFPCEAIRVVKVTVNGQEGHPRTLLSFESSSRAHHSKPERIGLRTCVHDQEPDRKEVCTSHDGRRFPHTEWVDGNGQLHRIGQYIEFGQLPEINQYTKEGVKVDDPAYKRPIAFMPGQEMTISLAPYADEMRKRIEERQPFDTITRCFILLQTSYFENGTEWLLVEYKIPDPGHRFLQGRGTE